MIANPLDFKPITETPPEVEEACKLFGRIPKNPYKQLVWRWNMRQAAMNDTGIQNLLRQAAFLDVLFFFNAMAWCFEPRALQKVKPFCTWIHQDPVILAMDQAITDSLIADDTGEELLDPVDLVVDKSRAQGATWMYLTVILRRWLKDSMFSAGLVTRTEDLVDSAKDQDTLMWKVIWSLDQLPEWMKPIGYEESKHRNLTEHSLINPEMLSTIVGYSASQDVGRGGRKTVFGMDELASFRPGDDVQVMNSTQHVTNCRLLVSTFKGDSGIYYESATGDNNAIKCVLDWKDNPTQNRLLYLFRDGRYRALNSEDQPALDKYVSERGEALDLLRRRGFKFDDHIRAPWYDMQCMRPGATPRGIAQELDRDPHGSVSKVFDTATINLAIRECCKPPLLRGNLVYDPETAEVRPPFITVTEGGDLKLWVKPDQEGKMPPSKYKVGADISSGKAGTYTSNSTLSVTNQMTGEQVAEWAANNCPPAKFAYVAVALCRWFDDAELIPEVNFEGGFLDVLLDEIGYENVYYREVEIPGVHVKTNKAGYWMKNDDVKLGLFEALQAAIIERAYTPRSEIMLKESKEYEWRAGKIVHVASEKSEDDAAKGKTHADRVIGGALSWFGCDRSLDLDQANEHSDTTEYPVGSMGARLQVWDDRNRWEDGYSEGYVDDYFDRLASTEYAD